MSARVTFREAGAALLWRGVPPARAASLLAIGTAESGRDTHAVFVIEGPFRGHYDLIGNEARAALQRGDRVMLGWLQINSRNLHNNLDAANRALDLVGAIDITKGYPLERWNTYKGVRYTAVLPAAKRMIRKLRPLTQQQLAAIVHGAGALPGEGVPHAVGDAAKAAAGALGATGRFLENVPQYLKIAAGGVMLLAGAAVLVRGFSETPAGRTLGRVAKTGAGSPGIAAVRAVAAAASTRGGAAARARRDPVGARRSQPESVRGSRERSFDEADEQARMARAEKAAERRGLQRERLLDLREARARRLGRTTLPPGVHAGVLTHR